MKEDEKELEERGLSAEELEQEAAADLPDREAMSLISPGYDATPIAPDPIFTWPYEPATPE